MNILFNGFTQISPKPKLVIIGIANGPDEFLYHIKINECSVHLLAEL